MMNEKTEKKKEEPGKQIKELIAEITKAIDNGKEPNPFYDLIREAIEKTKDIRANRNESWSDTLQKATIQRDRHSTFGFKASFSIADALTDVPDTKLLEGLKSINGILKKSDIGSEDLLQLKQFSNSLPSPEYKKTIDSIYGAALLCSLATLSLALPIAAPLTIPMIGPLLASMGVTLQFAVANVVMGAAGHVASKAFLEHATEDMYQKERFKVLNLASSTQGDDQVPLNEVREILTQIDQAKQEGQIKPLEAVKLFKNIRDGLNGDPKAVDKLNQEDMKFKLFSKDSLKFVKSTCETVCKKYPMLAMGAVGVMAVAAASTGIVPLIVTTAASFPFNAIGMGAVEASEKRSNDVKKAIKEASDPGNQAGLKDKVDFIHQAKSMMQQLREARANKQEVTEQQSERVAPRNP